jgi:outer membrane protein assembly factor BamB
MTRSSPYPSLGSVATLGIALTIAGCELLGIGDDNGRIEIAWSGSLPPGGMAWTGVPAVLGGRVIAEYGTGLRAWNLETGEVVWTRPLRTGVTLNSRNIVVADGRAFAAGGDSIYAVDASTGARLWAFLPDAQAALGEIGVDDRSVYIGTRSHRVYALDPATGQLQWMVDVGPTWPFLGVVLGITASADTVYVGAGEFLTEGGGLRRGHVVALDRSTGAELWRYITPNDQNDVTAAPRVHDRLLLVSDLYGGSFFALDRFTGQEVWRVHTSGLGPNRPPFVRGGVAYVGANDRFVYAVDVLTGRVRWSTDTGASVGRFALCGNMILAQNLELHALDLTNGEEVGALFVAQDEFLWSDFGVEDRRAFVVGNTRVYGLRCS